MATWLSNIFPLPAIWNSAKPSQCDENVPTVELYKQSINVVVVKRHQSLSHASFVCYLPLFPLSAAVYTLPSARNKRLRFCLSTACCHIYYVCHMCQNYVTVVLYSCSQNEQEIYNACLNINICALCMYISSLKPFFENFFLHMC